jgi:hypothetical protein
VFVGPLTIIKYDEVSATALSSPPPTLTATPHTAHNTRRPLTVRSRLTRNMMQSTTALPSELHQPPSPTAIHLFYLFISLSILSSPPPSTILSLHRHHHPAHHHSPFPRTNTL